MEELNIPFVDLQAKESDIERFSASTLIFLFDLHEPHTAYVLLCQRALLGKDENGNDKENSWAFSWEPPGGSQGKMNVLVTVRLRKLKFVLHLPTTKGILSIKENLLCLKARSI